MARRRRNTSTKQIEVEWPGDRCILCLEKAPLTIEHIIPSSLGGLLTVRFLCQPCNSGLGAAVEAWAKTDPSIRLAVDNLQQELPEFAGQFKEGQHFFSHGPAGTERGTIRNGEFRVRPRVGDDGSLIQPTAKAEDTIRNILSKRGCGEIPIEQALARFRDAPEAERTPLAPSLEITTWPTERVKPDFSEGKLLSPLVLLKMAYEHLACHFGTAVYDDAPQMSELRSVLRDHNEEHPCYSVERLHAPTYKPIHGLCFEGNDPYAKVQVRLFGKLAYRVHLNKLAVGGDRYAYTQNLSTGDGEIEIVSTEADA